MSARLLPYEKYIAKLGLTEAEMVSLKDQITEEFDKFPSIAQIYSTGRSATRTRTGRAEMENLERPGRPAIRSEAIGLAGHGSDQRRPRALEARGLFDGRGN